MTMVGVSVTSEKGMQFEATQEVYYGVIAQLTNLIIYNDLGSETEAIVKAKIEEVEAVRYRLDEFEAGELAAMAKKVKKEYQEFVDTLEYDGNLIH